MTFRVGQLIKGRYRLRRHIGDGGMGCVFEARHELLNTTAALKFLHPHLAKKGDCAERFLQEAQVSALIENPHVVRATDVDRTEDGIPFMVMEFVKGETLLEMYTRLRNENTWLQRGEAFDYIHQIFEGVEAAHALGAVHRDLKPDNVMIEITEDGRQQLRILDFGVAKLKLQQGGIVTKPGMVIGTPEYMAPEQALQASSVDVHADIFSLGVMFYEMLCGKQPVNGPLVAIVDAFLHGRFPPLDTVSLIEEELAQAVHRAMAAQTEDRYHTVAEFREALRPFLGIEEPTMPQKLRPPPGAHAMKGPPRDPQERSPVAPHIPTAQGLGDGAVEDPESEAPTLMEAIRSPTVEAHPTSQSLRASLVPQLGSSAPPPLDAGSEAPRADGAPRPSREPPARTSALPRSEPPERGSITPALGSASPGRGLVLPGLASAAPQGGLATPALGSAAPERGPAVSSMPPERGPAVSSMPPERGPAVSSMPPERGPAVSSMPPERGPAVSSMPPERGSAPPGVTPRIAATLPELAPTIPEEPQLDPQGRSGGRWLITAVVLLFVGLGIVGAAVWAPWGEWLGDDAPVASSDGDETNPTPDETTAPTATTPTATTTTATSRPSSAVGPSPEDERQTLVGSWGRRKVIIRHAPKRDAVGQADVEVSILDNDKPMSLTSIRAVLQHYSDHKKRVYPRARVRGSSHRFSVPVYRNGKYHITITAGTDGGPVIFNCELCLGDETLCANRQSRCRKGLAPLGHRH